MPQKRGVYFLANDRVLDIAIAFLNSFRRHNPSIFLCLIPFDDGIQQLTSLQSHYHFSIWEDHAVLQRCDDISLWFHPCIAGYYRKLAAWEGVYDEFIYIDSDTVVLENVGFVFEYLDRFDFVTAYSDDPDSRKWVWRDSIYETGDLTPRQISFAANTGFIASRKECLELDDVVARLPAAKELAPHMELSCYDQPLLNCLIVTSGRRYTSLRAIAMATGGPDVPQEQWAGAPTGLVVRDGRVVWPEVPRTLMVHWAGEWDRARREKRAIPHYALWAYYRHI